MVHLALSRVFSSAGAPVFGVVVGRSVVMVPNSRRHSRRAFISKFWSEMARGARVASQRC